MHKWPLQPFSQDCGLASHINHVVCINFIFYTFMVGVFILRVFARNLLNGRKSPTKNFLYFVLMADMPHYPLDYGNFKYIM